MLFLPRQRAKVYLNLCPSTKDYGVFFFLYICKSFSFLGHPRVFLITDLFEGESKSKIEPSCDDAGSW